jgi:hypothetical protein
MFSAFSTYVQVQVLPESRFAVPEKAVRHLSVLILAFFDRGSDETAPSSALRRGGFAPNELRSSVS